MDCASSAATMDTVLPGHGRAQLTAILCRPLQLRELMGVRCITKKTLILVSAAIRAIMDIAHQRLAGHVDLDLGKRGETRQDRRKVGSRRISPMVRND